MSGEGFQLGSGYIEILAVDATAPGIAAAERSVAASSAAMSRSTATASRSVAASSGIFGTATKSILKLGAAYAGLSVIKSAISDSVEYQSSITKVSAQLGLTTKTTNDLSHALLGIANSTATDNLDELAVSGLHAEASLRKMGATQKQVYDVITAAAKGAKISGADLEDTTNSLTATMASGIMPINQAGKAMGMLNAIVASGDMKFQDLNSALSTGVLVTAQTFGVSLKDAGATLAVFGDNNIRGAHAATQLRMSIQDLTKPAAGADKVLGQIKLTTKDLQDSMANHGLLGTLQLLKQRMEDAGITGDRMGVFLENAFTKRAGTGLAILLSHMPQLKDALDDETKQSQGFGAAYEKMTKTAAFQWDKFKTELKTFGVEVGSTVLPVVEKLGHFLADNGQALAKDALEVAALWAAWKGYKIVTSAMTAIMLTSRQMTGAVREGEVAFTGTQKAARLAGAAVAGFGAASIIDSMDHMNKSSSGAAKSMGVLGDAAAGAAMGVAVGGPWGAAVGGAAGLVTGLWHAFSGGKQAIQVSQDEISAWTQQLEKTNGVITATMRNQIGERIMENFSVTPEMVNSLSKYGVTWAKLVNSVASGKARNEMDELLNKLTMNNSPEVEKNATKIKEAFDKESTAIKGARNSAADLAKSHAQLAAAQKQASALGDSWAAAFKQGEASARPLAMMTGGIGKLSDAYKKNHAAVTYVIGDNGQLIETTGKAGTELDQTTSAMQRQTTASSILKNALDAMNGVGQTLENTQNAMAEGLDGLRNKSALATDANGNAVTSLNRATAAGAQNRDMIVSLIQSAEDEAAAVADQAKKHGATLPQAIAKGNAALKSNEQRIVAAAKAAGLDGQQVQSMIDKMGKLNKVHADPTIDIKNGQSLGAYLDHIQKVLSDLNNKRVSFTLDGVVQTIFRSNGTSHPGVGMNAAGGFITGPGTGTSDSIPSMLSNGEYVINAAQTKKYFPLIDAINKGIKGFAGGGLVGTASQVANIMKSAGYPAAAIAGVLGNMANESGVEPYRPQGTRPGTTGDLVVGGGGWGLVQWTSEGYQRYLMDHFGKRPSVAQQMSYLLHLMDSSGLGSTLKKAKDPRTAAYEFDMGFEKPGYNNAGDREKSAEQYYATITGGGYGSGKGTYMDLGGGSNETPFQKAHGGMGPHAFYSQQLGTMMGQIGSYGAGFGEGGSYLPQGVSVPFQVANGRQFNTIMGQVNDMIKKVRGEFKQGLIGKRAFKADMENLKVYGDTAIKQIEEIRKQRMIAAQQTATSDMQALLSANGIDNTASPLTVLNRQLRRMGIGDKFISHLDKNTATLRGLNGSIAHLDTRLQNANQLFSSDKSAITGQFDLSSMGTDDNGSSMQRVLATGQAELRKTRRFVREVKRLNRMHMPAQMLQQIIQAGPDSPNAFIYANASIRQVHELEAEWRDLNHLGAVIGQVGVQNQYGQTRNQMRRQRERDQHQAQMIGREIAREVRRVEHSRVVQNHYDIHMNVNAKEIKEIQDLHKLLEEAKHKHHSGHAHHKARRH